VECPRFRVEPASRAKKMRRPDSVTNLLFKRAVEARRAHENEVKGSIVALFQLKFDAFWVRIGRIDMAQRDESGPALLLAASTGPI
jgi:hypothetical protein